MRDLPAEGADSPQEQFGGEDDGGGLLIQKSQSDT
jgi:hypothetical protein